jgi:hypothetical protein
MNNTLLNCIIGLSASIIAVLAFSDEIGKLYNLKILKSIKFKFITFIIASIIGIFQNNKLRLKSLTHLGNK